MAEVHDPVGDTPAERSRRAARPEGEPATNDARAGMLQPPTEEELAQTGEPTAEEVRAAAGGDGSASAQERVDPATRRLDSVPPDPIGEPEERIDPATRRLDSVPPDPIDEPEERVVAREPRGEAVPAAAAAAPVAAAAAPAASTAASAAATAPAERQVSEPAPPAAPRGGTPIEPAAEQEPPPPRVQGNRLVGTAWVLLAAGLFQVLFFAANALVALVFGGTAAVVPQLQSIAGTALAWLPVLLFFLLFLLTVLISGRAGRFAYVFSSLVVGAAVYVATVLLFSLIVRQGLGDANTLAQTFLNWEFILIGLVARETMLWTGLAIGSRGIRVRGRNRAERKRYEEELAEARG